VRLSVLAAGATFIITPGTENHRVSFGLGGESCREKR